jgi:DNA-binding transcriptional LysR family regulator
MAEDNAARRHPEDVAAFVNGLLVLFLPPASLMLGMFFFPSTSVAVHPERSFYASTGLFLTDVVFVMVPLVPFAMLAGWRTWVHARRYVDGQGTGWQGVIEGGTAGLVAALVVLSRGIATRPREAAPYIIAYGGGGMLLGLAFGLLLRTTALIVLKQLGVESRATAP